MGGDPKPGKGFPLLFWFFPPPPPPQVLKLGGAVLEAGRQLVGSSRALAVGLREMGGGPKRDPLLKVRTPPPPNI